MRLNKLSIIMNGNEKCFNCSSKKLVKDNNSLSIRCLSCNNSYPKYEELSQKLPENKNLLFGYGSLILPTSLISRFCEMDIEISSIYSKNSSKNYIRGEALIKLDEFDINIIPVKISGYKRVYSYDSRRGGKMLECYSSQNDSDYINGVIIKGLSNEQIESINSSEHKYNIEKIEPKELKLYNNKFEVNKPVNIYTSEKKEGSYTERNKIYHKRILAGIYMLKEIYNKEIMLQFYRDFARSF